MSEQGGGLKINRGAFNPADVSAVKALAEEYAFVHDLKPPDIGSRQDCPVARMRALRQKIHELDSPRTALCLSGGGIRSATFSLGVVQALAAGNLLKRFHYLSTVSGGGYLGSWLSSWIAREQAKATAPEVGRDRVVTQLTNPQARPKAEPGPVSRLRAYSNYLSPVWGMSLDFITLIATFLRNLFLNWMVLVPALMALLMVAWINITRLMQVPTKHPWVIGAVFTLACVLMVAAIAYVASDMPHKEEHKPRKNLFAAACLVPFVAASVMLTWVWAWLAAGVRVPYVEGWFAWLNRFWPFSESHYSLVALLGVVIHAAGCVVGAIWRRQRRTSSTKKNTRPVAVRIGVGLVGAFVIAIVGAGTSCAMLAIGQRLFSLATPENQLLFATLGMPLLLCCIWLGANIYAALTRLASTEGDREWWGRASAWFLYVILGWVILHGVVIYLPQLVFELDAVKPLAVKSTGLLGIIAGIVGFWNKTGLGRLAEKAQGIRRMLGDKLLEAISLAFIIVLLGGLALLTSTALDHAVPQSWRYAATVPVTPIAATEPTAGATKPDAEASKQERIRQAQSRITHYRAVFPSIPWIVAFGALIVLVLSAMAMSAIIGPNTFSMQAMYGNRLVRAYLGASRDDREPNPFTGFDAADNIAMCKVGQRGGLFHVVNVALNMVSPSGGRLEWQQRKAASFTISPLHSGSAHLGYQPSRRYANGISLGRAMTLSGAAASPNMGYHSSALVTFVMAFFNVRLGGWLPNPGPVGRKHWRKADPNQRGPGVVNEALGRTTDTQPFVYLSDGGHFENLGLYEMVYRRCSDIVVVDASCDPDYEYEDLENAIRKVRTDLGITIEFKEALPSPDNPKHYVTGTIHYKKVDGAGARDGRIIYIKPLLTGDEPLDVQRYARLHVKDGDQFPHQSTSDQFFDEAQFESYRELGRHSGSMLLYMLPTFGHWPPPPVVLPPDPTPQSEGATADEAPLEDGTSLLQRDPIDVQSGAAAAIDSARRNVFSPDGLSVGTALLMASIFFSSGVVEGEQPTIDDPTPPTQTSPPTDEPNDSPTVVINDPAGSSVNVANRIELPLFAEASNCPDDSTECRNGIAPEDATTYLNHIAESLLACTAESHRVVVRIEGFASSSAVRKRADFEELNLRIAQQRAEVVKGMLRKAIDAAHERNFLPRVSPALVEITAEDWNDDPAKMRKRAGFVDNLNGYDSSRGRWNRRVDLVLSDSGACAPAKVAAN